MNHNQDNQRERSRDAAAVPEAREEQGASLVVRHGGEYRWTHDVNLWTDTLIPLTVLKILVASALAPALLILLISVFEGNASEGLRAFTIVFGVTAGILLALFIVAYPVFLLVKGGRYAVLFALDDKGINHVEMPATTRRSDLLNWVGIIAGAAAGNPTVTGANLLALSRKQLYSAFKNVRKVVVYERRNVLKLICSDMTRNLVYTQPSDFDLVKTLVLDRCRKDVKITIK